MATLLVGYDLNRPGQDYPELFEKLKSLRTWWHHLDSTWLVVTDLTPKQLRDQLRLLIDENDELFVVDVSGRAAAWYGFNESGSAWLKANL